MGQRNLFSGSQFHQGISDQGWHHEEQPFSQMARPVAPESNTTAYSLESTVEGGQSIQQWISAPVSAGYTSSSLNVELPIYPLQISGPSHGPPIHIPVGGSLPMVPQYYGHHASSSNHGEQNVYEVDNGCFEHRFEHRAGNSRGSLKRKRPSVPAVFERGNTSQYSAGSSSRQSTPDDSWLEKQNADSHHAPWLLFPGYRANGLSDEADLRNVRSRPELGPQNTITMNHVSNSPSQPSFTSQTPGYSSSMDFLVQGPIAPSREWSHTFPSSASSGRNIISDYSISGDGRNPSSSLFNRTPNVPLGMGGHLNDWHASSSEYVRGVRSSSIQRPMPTFRTSSANLTMDSMVTSDVGSQFSAGRLPVRHSRPLSALGFHAGDRNGRRRSSCDRYRTFSDSAGFGDQLTPEGRTLADGPPIYGSRHLIDQHMAMRLDVDSMSYEELLALGERIGCVNTGLSDDLIEKCLIESTYSYLYQQPDEKRCVICLEEYGNMDQFGRLKSCGHDFHVGCIRKWLSIKNLCPICKASALEDGLKNK